MKKIKEMKKMKKKMNKMSKMKQMEKNKMPPRACERSVSKQNFK
jgi:intracellular sulfur oxidation DsrE/DsrF family protein